jgi:hypothetical protein
MSSFDFPVLDGIAPSWADINVRISPTGGNLIEMGDIAAINTDWAVEEGQQREGGRVLKRTSGSLEQNGSITLYASGYQKFLRGLKSAMPLNAKGQRRASLAFFLIHVVYTPPGSTDLLEYKAKGCRMLGRTIDASEGTDAQQVEVPLSVLELVDIIDGEEIVGL